MTEHRATDQRDEADLSRLLAKVGARHQPSADATASVQAAVETEWRQMVAARRQRRRYTGWAAAAGIAVAAVGAWLARPLYLSEAAPVATVARVVGEVQLESGQGRWTALAAGSEIRAGVALRTGGDGRAALDLASGVHVRLDQGTQLAFNDPQEARLSQGAVYVDSGADAGRPSAPFVLVTPLGDVRHLGTQYEARLTDGVLKVGIREGRIEVTGQRGAVTGRAGEVLSIDGGQVTRAPLTADSAAWDWVTDVTPPFSIEGRSVGEFLAWASRETGRTIEYASPEAERVAGTVTLNGTVADLRPEQAVMAVLATTSLRPTLAGDRIRIDVDPASLGQLQ